MRIVALRPITALVGVSIMLALSTGAKSGFAATGLDEIVSLARRGLLDSAQVLCRKVLAADPDDAPTLLMLGKLTPEGAASAGFFKRAVAAGGGSPAAEESLFRLGQFHYAAGKYHSAIPYFRNYLRAFPSGDWSGPAHYWMGNACLSLARSRPDRAAYLDSALNYFQRLLDTRKPEEYYHALAREGLAKGMATKGDRNGALEKARAALADAPDDARAPLMLLLAQLRQGMDREGEKAMMAGLIKAYPRSPESKYLRKLNPGADPSRWKSGYAFPRPLEPKAENDTLENDEIPAGPAKVGAGDQTPPGRASASGAAYTLQLAAFSQPANAKSMMAKLVKLGFTPELVETRRRGKLIFQVRMGRFASSEEASDFALENLKPHKLLSQPVPLHQ